MKKLISLTLLALVVSFASFAQTLPIFGVAGCCVGSSSYLEDSTVGGVWSSSNVVIATVSSLGDVTGVSAGTCTISYTAGGVSATYGYTVSPTPAAITCPSVVCVGSSITASDATAGGVWSSSAPSLATISSMGVINGIATGITTIEYTMGVGCYAYLNVSVGSTSLAAITGDSSVCVGSTIALADVTPGGTWTSSGPAATVSGTGVVTGVSTGSVNITYSVAGGSCGAAYVIRTIAVASTVSAGTITGTGLVTVGSTTTLADGAPGGSWTSSNTSIATVGVSSGVVTGVAVGTATITYSVTGCGGTVFATAGVTVSAAPPVNRISGHVLFTSGAPDSTGPIKVWLIKYNPTTLLLTAIDSVTLYSGSTSVYYQFLTAASDSYRVKAAYYPATFSSTGYIPTYYTSAFYWHDATAFYHTNPTADDSKDITMAYGTVTAGPGFIGGSITTGANKGTSGTVPAVGMLVYVLNSSSTVMQQTYTDATGAYSFNNLPLGTYTIYPEAINFSTTAYTGITLTSISSSMHVADFGQHTLSKTILPATTGIQNVTSSVSSIITFPNPTSGKLNIQWNESANEKGTVTISDITGREVFTSVLNMNQGAGASQMDISSLTSGVYMISVKSGTINYNNKIQVQK